MTGYYNEIDIDLATVDDDNIAAAQQMADAGNILINGAGASGNTWTSPDGIAKQIGIYSASDINTVVFTVTGYQDQYGNLPVTETITGVNNSTVESTNYYYKILTIAVDAAVASNFIVGPVDEAVSPIFPLDYTTKTAPTVSVDVTGTINFTVQETFDDVYSGATATWVDIAALATKTADTTAQTSIHATAIRILINSHSAGAELQANILESRV